MRRKAVFDVNKVLLFVYPLWSLAWNSFRQSIHDLLAALPTQRLDALKQLFWSELNYARANAPLPRGHGGWNGGKPGGYALLFATAEGFMSFTAVEG